MKDERGSVAIIILIVFLVVIFVSLLFMSTRGWGYAGYRGYRYGPSIWYWGGPRYYPHSRSIRGGSVGGPVHRGGGLHGGK